MIDASRNLRQYRYNGALIYTVSPMEVRGQTVDYVRFAAQGQSASQSINIDNFSVIAVPEPGSAILLGAGLLPLAGVVIARCRRAA